MEKNRSLEEKNSILIPLVRFLLNKFESNPEIQEISKKTLQEMTNIILPLISSEMENDAYQEHTIQDSLILQMIQLVGERNFHDALVLLGNALKKGENWLPQTKYNCKFKIKSTPTILAEQILQLCKEMGPAVIPILIEAYLEDSFFIEKIHELQQQEERTEQNIYKAYRMLKEQRLFTEIEKYGAPARDIIQEILLKHQSSDPQYPKLMALFKKIDSQTKITQDSGFDLLL